MIYVRLDYDSTHSAQVWIAYKSFIIKQAVNKYLDVS